MSKFSDWQETKYENEKSIDWLKNSSKIDSQNRNPYKLIVRVSNETFQYCGQSSAGANNYHSYGESFKKYLNESMKINSDKIFNDAVDLMNKKCNEMAILAKDEVAKMNEEISAIEQL